MLTSPLAPPDREILVVDDDADVRDVIAGFLQFRGYGVEQAGDGAAALRKLAEHPTLRLVISDVRMPGLTGTELARQAATRFPMVRVILISGYFQTQTEGVRFLRKPFGLDELEAVVQAELQTLRSARP